MTIAEVDEEQFVGGDVRAEEHPPAGGTRVLREEEGIEDRGVVRNVMNGSAAMDARVISRGIAGQGTEVFRSEVDDIGNHDSLGEVRAIEGGVGEDVDAGWIVVDVAGTGTEEFDVFNRASAK